MGLTSALVLYAITWFMTLFVLLPIGLRTQGDDEDVTPGTHAGSPSNFDLGRKARQTTVWATILWAAMCLVITSGWITVRDYDWAERMPPAVPAADGRGG